jgi:hypothetical protein
LKEIPNECITVFVVAEEKEAYEIATQGLVNIVVGEKGLVKQRAFIEQYYPAGAHVVSLDDDLEEIDTPGFASLHDFFVQAFEKCVQEKVFLWGVYPVFNPFYRLKRQECTTHLNYIIGAFFGFINRPGLISLTLADDNKEDVERSILYFQKDGKVVRFNRVGMKTKYYGTDGGGMGTLEQRREPSKKAVEYLCSTYEDYGRVVVRDNGLHEFRLKPIKPFSLEDVRIDVLAKVPVERFDDLYSQLERTKLKKIVQGAQNSRHGFPTHDSGIFGLVKQRVGGKVALSNISLDHPELYDVLQQLGRELAPPGFEFTSIQVNRDTIAPPHRDSNNVGKSLLVSFGEYTGCRLVVEGVEYDAKYQPIVFNGSLLKHWNTQDLVGRKYSLIYFSIKTH